jgi:hypothetical protein
MERITARHCRRSHRRSRPQGAIGFDYPTGFTKSGEEQQALVDSSLVRAISYSRSDRHGPRLSRQPQDGRGGFGTEP